MTIYHGHLIELETKALTDTGEFDGYASIFDLEDLGRDIVRPGAFAKSLQRRPAGRIKLLRGHDPSALIGVWAEAEEDAKGLRVKGQLILETATGRETHALMKAGALDGLSIGFRTIRDRFDRQKGVRYLEEVDLLEISVVTWPANPKATVSGVKGEAEVSEARRIVDAANRIAGRL